MNRRFFNSVPRRGGFAPYVPLGLAVVGAMILPGCGKNDTFAKVNGQVITTDEYVHTLERQTVQVQGGQPTNALRVVLDKLIGDRVIMAEAAKNNVVPSDAEIDKYYAEQKKIFEAQYPGKDYEKVVTEQGSLPEDVKREFRYRLAESALYAKRLNVTEEDLKKAYEQLKGQNPLSLPLRYQLRLIMTQSGSSNYSQAKQMLDQKKKFEDVARQVNPPQMKATGGLIPAATPVNGVPKEWATKLAQTAEGAYFGPVDYQVPSQPGMPPQTPLKAWVQVEHKLAPFQVSYDDARLIVRSQVVQQKMFDPANTPLRNEIMNQKMASKFEASDKAYEGVWGTVKDGARAAGLGQSQAAPAPVAPPPPGK